MKIKITQLLICSVLMMAGVAQAQEGSFVVPSPKDLASMSDAEKMELFQEFDSLPSEEKAEAHRIIQSLPESETEALLSEYMRLVVAPNAAIEKAKQANENSAPMEETSAPAVDDAPNGVAILMVVMVILIIVLGLLLKYRKKEDVPPVDDLA
ncbi:hypothetical protein H6785_02520 [Candidatus Nomurabacteria bacterium]|nr:hypothetical protein [Candidatus Kaiserbacteria bacterium]MCB9815424.1 hypothetical protein [Candidatus Nomurabacteria bacterium]